MDKGAITPALVERLLRRQFPEWAHLPVVPVALDGWDNTTFRLGAHLSVRFPSADGYVAQVDKEQRWLPILAPRLPLAIPTPVARGSAGRDFPRPWSIYRWLDGTPATAEKVDDLERFATDLAGFLCALYAIDSTGGPPPGEHNFHRGAPLDVYDDQTRGAIAELGDVIDGRTATEVWETALATSWRAAPVWLHGDVTGSNLLVVDGRLSAVIDFGCCAIGDPACDLTIAWTFLFGQSRAAFRDGLALDDETWARARGWALWKALVTLVKERREGGEPRAARRFGWRVGADDVVEEVLGDHRITSGASRAAQARSS